MRSLFFLILTLAALAAAIMLGPAQETGTRLLALGMAGQYSYSVTLGGSVIGRYTTAIEVGDTITMRSRLEARVTDTALLQTEETLHFSATKPYQLLSATATEQTSHGAQVIDIHRADNHHGGNYVAHVELPDGQTEQRQLPWEYALADHLALESWLRSTSPAIGDKTRVSILDFDRLAPTPETWRVVGKHDNAYIVATPAPLDDTLVQLDAHFVPELLSTAGLFTITRTDAPAPSIDARGLPALNVPIESAIEDPEKVSSVTLSVSEAAARHFDAVPGTRIEATDGGWRLHRLASTSRPATQTEAREAMGESVAIPSAHPSIKALAAQVAGSTDSERLISLTRLVHNHLSYNETTRGTLIDAVVNRQGDCTEFSDLLTAVARAMGLPAVTITGLTYGEVDGPGFYLHAWNEVVVDGEWVAVDPTWNLTRVDALHIPLPSSSVRFLAAYAEMNDMHFAVESVRYF